MMNWDSVKNFIGDAAPIVGGLLAPATGGISVAVGGLIAKTLGVEEGISFRGFFVSKDGNKTWERVA